ncbi:uncharacterized protein SCHCODRAFT_02686265 [Schizophyllum commune H4-8]|uniref:C2H2-type domain-containing protein n=1 Tax=Schizophyllum commune (strain H4-8 / FGSC 9210) TaxID=578458 RepID=D8Q319_SCHCM|nr:uncharacterized protein SCHCODRAFT_02686265 [Schizophyllum commune H4-8]KAI5894700.1 hypothetical protein SCHCODRAFT_02686265 [Schizophyllum commune H4-8]
MSDNATLFAAIIPPKPFRPIAYDQWPPELKQELRGVPKVEVYDLAENGFLVVRNNECGICHELVKGQRNLQQHARNHMPSHMTPDNSWRCPVCMGTFAQKVGAQTHINSMHTHETRWACRHAKCKFVCLDRATLNRHESRCQHRPSAVMEPAGVVKKKAEPKCRALQVQPPVKPRPLEAPSVGSKPCPLAAPSVDLKPRPLELPKLEPKQRPLDPPRPSVEHKQRVFELPPVQLPSAELKPPLGLPPMQLPPAKSPSNEQPAVEPPLMDLSVPSLFPKPGSSRSLLNPKSPSPPPSAQRTEPAAEPVEPPARSAQPFVQNVRPPTEPVQPSLRPAQPSGQPEQPPAPPAPLAMPARPPVTPPPVIWNVGPPALPIHVPAHPSIQPTAPPQVPLHPPRPSARHSRPSLSIPRELLNRSRLPREPPEFSFKTDDDPVFPSLRGPQPWRVPRPSAPSLLKPFSVWYEGLAQASAPVKSEPPKARANPPPTVRNDLTFVNIAFHNLPPASVMTPVKSEPSNNPPLPDTKSSVPPDDTSVQDSPLGFDKPEERLTEELLPPGSLIPPKATLRCNDDNTVDLGDGTKLAFVNGVCTYPDCGLKFSRCKRDWTRHAMVHMKYENKKDLSWRCGAEGCGKLYSTKHGAKEHFFSMHTNARPYTCQICHHTFSRVDAVRKHMRGIHGQIKRKTQQLYRPSSMAGARARAANNAISAGLRKTSTCASSSDRGSSVDSSVDDASSGGPSRKSSVASRTPSTESLAAPVASRRGSATSRSSTPAVDAPQCPSPSHPRPTDDAMATDDEGTVQGEEPPPKYHWQEMPSSSLRPVKLEPTDDDLVSVVEFDVDSGDESDIPIEIEYDDESMDMD